jgi:hypothetical protein
MINALSYGQTFNRAIFHKINLATYKCLLYGNNLDNKTKIALAKCKCDEFV